MNAAVRGGWRLPPFVLIAAFAGALTLCLLGFMTVAAVLPQLIDEWSLSNAEAGWIGGIFFAGYVSAVPVLASLTDRIDTRRIYLASAAAGGGATIALALFADGFWSALVLRYLGGLGLAGTYMPGLRALTELLPERARNRGLVYYTSTFALGSGLSVLIGGEIAAWQGWRWAFGLAGLGFFAALAIVAAVLPPKPPDPAARPATHPLDFRPVLRNQPVMSYVAALVGTAWEVFAYRVWAVAFLAHVAARRPEASVLASPTVTATVIALIGIPASIAFGEIAARTDRRHLLMAVAAASAGLALAIGFAAEAPYEVVVGLCLLLGMTSYGRNSATTAGMMAEAEPRIRGATMALYAFVGFSGGIFGPLATGLALDAGGGRAEPAGWLAGFAALAAGPVITIAALAILGRRPR